MLATIPRRPKIGPSQRTSLLATMRDTDEGSMLKIGRGGVYPGWVYNKFIICRKIVLFLHSKLFTPPGFGSFVYPKEPTKFSSSFYFEDTSLKPWILHSLSAVWEGNLYSIA